MKSVSTQIQHGSFLLCPNGSHLAMWDDQQTYLAGLNPRPRGHAGLAQGQAIAGRIGTQ